MNLIKKAENMEMWKHGLNGLNIVHDYSVIINAISFQYFNIEFFLKCISALKPGEYYTSFNISESLTCSHYVPWLLA